MEGAEVLANDDSSASSSSSSAPAPAPAPASIVPASSTPPDQEEQKRIISDMMDACQMQAGDTWYIISAKWWNSWGEYIGAHTHSYYYRSENPPHPGEIDNKGLVDDNGTLFKEMIEPSDFALLPEEPWKKLLEWYGGGPEIPRKVITRMKQSSQLMVEARPLVLHVSYSNTPNESFTMEISKADTVGSLKSRVFSHKNINAENARVWDYHDNRKLKVLTDADERLDEAQILHEQNILVEMKSEDGTWPDDGKSDTYPYSSRFSSYGSSYGSYGSSYTSSYGSSRNRSSPATKPGLTGLTNLGNTCFMNSSLQCLSNTGPLSEFFIGNKYLNDINAENPLGMKGKLAEEFARLVRELWNGYNSSVAPRDFKSKLEEFAPQFSGFHQHDSQELLAFLLDGLHEDLNRVKKKPYVEMKEGDGRPDEEVAQEAWELHKSRNDSIVVDWFQGQLKSTLVCPECSRVSITFDPFMYLSLPLPVKTTRTVPLTFFSLDVSKTPMKYGVKVQKTASIADLKRALSDLCAVPAEGLVITEVFNSRFFKKYNDQDNVESITDRDVINAYEIYVSRPDESSWDTSYSPVYHLRETANTYYSYGPARKSLFGVPFIVSFPAKANYKQLYNIVVDHVQKYLKTTIPKLNIEPAPTEGEPMSVDTTDTAEQQARMETGSSGSGYDSDSEDGAEAADSDDDTSLIRPKKASSSSSSKKPSSTGATTADQSVDPNLPFSLIVTDAYGSNEKRIVDDGRPLDLEDRQHLAISWNTDFITKNYDEFKEKEVTAHASSREEEVENSDITLDKCLELFTATERLGPDDPWYCSKCKEHRQATKKFDLWKVPPILVIHLKRFSYRNRYFREKLETFVNYPVRGLDISAHLKCPSAEPPIYDLYAVSNHYGSMGGGHYTAYALNKNTNKWYKFDDSYVSDADAQQVVSSAGYVLFYRRRDTFSIPSTVSASNGEETNNNSSDSNNNSNNNADADDDSDDDDNQVAATNSRGYHYSQHSSHYSPVNRTTTTTTSNHAYDLDDDTDEEEQRADSSLELTSGISGGNSEFISADSSDPDIVDMSSSADDSD